MLDKALVNHPKTSLVLSALLVAGQARAEPPAGPPLDPKQAWDASSPREIAHQHFNRGVELAGQGEYERALAEFQTAYERFPHFAVLYNMGQAYILLGRPIEAIDKLEQYLRDGKDQIPAPRVERTAEQIDAQRTQVAELRVAVNVPSAALELDGRPVGSAPLVAPLRVNPGTHLLSLRAPDRPALLRSVTLGAGQVLDLALELPSAPAPPALEPPAITPALSGPLDARAAVDAGPPSHDLRVLGYVLGGVGVALAGSALAHYAWNRERYQDWNAEQRALGAERVDGSYDDRQNANNELSASIDRAQIVTWALALSGAACVAGGSVLIVVNTGGSEPAAASARGVQVSVRGEW